MRLDERLLQSMEHTDQPIIHLYDWEGDAATYGYFSNPATLVNLEEATRHGWNLVKRVTGGGVIFHKYDLSFSILLPSCHPGYSTNTLENYAYINQRVANAIAVFLDGKVSPELNHKAVEAAVPTFCMVQPTIYDVVIEGCKVAGAAQRRTKYGLLHHGSICMQLPEEQKLKGVLPAETLSAMINNSYPIQNKDDTNNSRKRLKRLLIEALV